MYKYMYVYICTFSERERSLKENVTLSFVIRLRWLFHLWDHWFVCLARLIHMCDRVSEKERDSNLCKRTWLFHLCDHWFVCLTRLIQMCDRGPDELLVHTPPHSFAERRLFYRALLEKRHINYMYTAHLRNPPLVSRMAKSCVCVHVPNPQNPTTCIRTPQCTDISFVSRKKIRWNALWTELHWLVSWRSKRTQKTRACWYTCVAAHVYLSALLQCVAVCCSVLQYVAVLQYATALCVLVYMCCCTRLPLSRHVLLQSVAMCCSVLQCIVVCWSMLPCCSVLPSCACWCTCVAAHLYLSAFSISYSPRTQTLHVVQCVVECCSVLQCVAVCCSVL